MSTATNDVVRTFRIAKSQQIDAPPADVWEAIFEEIGGKMTDPSGNSLGLKIEPHVGGRWYRDLGNGVGHLWGFVQVIKAPKVLEINGPMFMSYAAAGHVQYRLTPSGEGTKLDVLHTAVGLIPEGDMSDVGDGWAQILEGIKKAAEKRRAVR